MMRERDSWILSLEKNACKAKKKQKKLKGLLFKYLKMNLNIEKKVEKRATEIQLTIRDDETRLLIQLCPAKGDINNDIIGSTFTHSNEEEKVMLAEGVWYSCQSC